MSPRLVVFSVIRNGILNGYPFVEAYSAWLDHCDELFVLDGHSSDGTDVVLQQMAALTDKIKVASAPWPQQSSGGSAIADFTNDCLARVRTRGDMLLYIQADEIVSRDVRARVRARQDSSALRFNHYVLFHNSMHEVVVLGESKVPGVTAWPAIRLFPSTAEARSTGDGFSFDVSGVEVAQTDDEILHYGWCFPVNILQKHMNHASLYPDNWRYRKRGKLAAHMLRRRSFDPALLNALDPQYHSQRQPFAGAHPECVRHLIDKEYYDPYVGLALLREGARW